MSALAEGRGDRATLSNFFCLSFAEWVNLRMRVLVLTALLLFYFFAAAAGEDRRPAGILLQKEKKEVHLSADRSTPVPVTDKIQGTPNMQTLTQARRYMSTGGTEISSFVLRQALIPSPHLVIPGKEAFCIPIALRLLFPRHYFW